MYDTQLKPFSNISKTDKLGNGTAKIKMSDYGLHF